MKPKVKIRESNFELLRLIAMIMVVVVHVDFGTVGWPTATDLQDQFGTIVMKILVESFCIVCVDVFVLISGWFGIRPNAKKLAGFFFQCLFFSIGLWLACPLWGVERISSIKEIIKNFMCLEYWFVPAYLCLLILSPVLNSFIEKGGEKEIKTVIVAFFAFQLAYGWLVDTCGFGFGYSTLSFIGLYLLGRYLKLYSHKLSSLSCRTDFVIYAVSCSLIASLEILLLRNGVQKYALFFYNSPLVIIASVFLILGVSKIHFQSKVVNYIAASTFSIYLFHLHPAIFPVFQRYVVQVFSNYSGFSAFGVITLLIIIVCALSILIDQIRKVCWKLISYKWKTNQ